MRIWPGQPYPLGATWDGRGVNFALYSEHAEKVELCLFDSPDAKAESARIVLPEYQRPGVARLFARRRAGATLRLPRVRSVRAGQRPSVQSQQSAVGSVCQVHRPNFALGRFDVRLQAWGTRRLICRSTSATTLAYAPLAKVIDTAFTWGDDRPPRTPWQKTLIYELHVKGFTKLHPEVPEPFRGTYAGLGSEPVLRHLQELGVTAVELLPVHYHLNDRHLVEKGLTNYWGYNTLNFFAPENDYAAADSPLDAVMKFKTMVRNLHSAGIEVIFDVVYNHTAEGNQMGPTLVVPRHRQRLVLPAFAGRPAVLHGFHRLRQHAAHAKPARAAVDYG